MQALYKLGESKAVVKVRKEDLALIKDLVEPARSKFSEARLSLLLPRIVLKYWKHGSHLLHICGVVGFCIVWLGSAPELDSVT